jgi:altronate dehydratase large subunit
VEISGYRRANGAYGIRNHVLVLPLHIAACAAAYGLADRVEGLVAVTHDWNGLGSARDITRAQRVFAGFAGHPNVFGTILVALDDSQTEGLSIVLEENVGRIHFTSLAANGGTAATIENLLPVAAQLTAAATQQPREVIPVCELCIGLECGGSDALSGITANPALGIASDMLIAAGGRSILAETSELLGAEHLLAARAVDAKVGGDLIEMISRFERDVAVLGVDLVGGQPVPGNIAGGLTTIEEKSLGAAKKGGDAPIQGVLDFAEAPVGPGLFVMDTPGNDIEQMVGMVAAGCQLVAFTTGRGTPTGSPIAPCLKISTRTALYERLACDTDVNAGSVLDGSRTLTEVGSDILTSIIDTADGALTAAERHGERQFAISRLDPAEVKNNAHR